MGLHAAGFVSAFAIDNGRDACSTYSALFPDSKVCVAPIEEVDLSHLRGHVDLVAGGPPCQPFSSGGKRLGASDERDMIPEFIRAVDIIRPPVFLMENVEGLSAGQRRTHLSELLRQCGHLGYEVTWKVLNAADYGVPQKRKRLFIVGSRIGTYQFPSPTHGPQAGTPYRVAGTILSRERHVGIPNPARVFYAKNPEPRPSPYDGHLFNGGGRPVDLSDVCQTILASSGGNKTPFVDTLDEVPKYHAELRAGKPPREGELPGGRRLTVDECALIQTFPVGMKMSGCRSSQYKQIGNAVPPLLAKHLGLSIRAHLTGQQGEFTLV